MTIVISFISSIAIAQQVAVARVAVNAGSATDVTGVTSSATSVLPSVLLTPSQNIAISLAGSGTAFRGGTWSGSAAGGVTVRRPIGTTPFAIVVDGRSSITATSFNHTFLTGDLTPAVELQIGALTLFGGGRVSRSLIWQPDQSPGGLPVFPTRLNNDGRVLTRRSGRSASYGAQLQVNAAHGIPVTASYREERGQFGSTEQTDRAARVAVSRGAVGLTASALSSTHALETFQGWSAAAVIAISPIVAVEIAAGKHPANRMTGVAAGRFINAGASFRLHTAQRRMPQPIGVAAPRAGETRVSIKARDAERVEVAGDFTNWTMQVARRTSNGVWYLDFAIPPGQYRYSFRIDGEEWRVPAGAQVAEDDFGVKTAWLTVRGSAAGEQAKHKEEE